MAAVNNLMKDGNEHGKKKPPILFFSFFSFFFLNAFRHNGGTHVMKEDDTNGNKVLNPWERACLRHDT